ncbi:Heat shock protein 70 family [Dillenia turbinata]|uniref:Heat shock protein 70 family n=1 Tax=Dillenia turbinata TaxID=194707 RepID=A0AAN8W7D6_9MAGN
MVKEAEQFAEEDRIARERIDSKNELETYLYDKKSIIDDMKLRVNRISSQGKKRIETTLEEAFEWLDVNPNAVKEDYEKKMEEVEVVWNLVIQKAKSPMKKC